ncbi:hypothetical protein RugamoR64_10800 [Duganella rhizosphaerae]
MRHFVVAGNRSVESTRNHVPLKHFVSGAKGSVSRCCADAADISTKDSEAIRKRFMGSPNIYNFANVSAILHRGRRMLASPCGQYQSAQLANLYHPAAPKNLVPRHRAWHTSLFTEYKQYEAEHRL